MNFTDKNFEQETAKADKPVLVDFFAEWCGPCSVLGPILEKIAEDFKDRVILAKINVDEYPLTSQKFNIDRIPAIMLFKNGQPVSSFIGLMPESDIRKWLEQILTK